MPDSRSSEDTEIRFHLDAPAAGECLDTSELTVRGWLIAGPAVSTKALEIWAGNELIAQTEQFHSRPDVIEAHRLPAESRNGFEVRVRSKHASRLEVRARMNDGSTKPLTVIDLETFPRRPTPLGTLLRSIGPDALGLEIGAHVNPVPGITPYYTDAVADFAGTAGTVDFLSHATALPIPTGCLDYLCASHVLEHLPNPIAALFEWHRVLKPGGHLYLVIPDQRFTFDHGRSTTDVRHLLEDFRQQATASHRVALHVDEFVFETDWSMLRPRSSKANESAERAAARASYLDQVSRRQYIDIHYHTFTPASVRKLFECIGFSGGWSSRFEAVAWSERYPPDRGDGIGVLLRKSSSSPHARPAETYHLRHANPKVPMLPIVCPATLDALHLRERDGVTALVSDGGRNYSFSHAIPELVPDAGAAIARQWERRVRREFVYWAGVLRAKRGVSPA